MSSSQQRSTGPGRNKSSQQKARGRRNKVLPPPPEEEEPATPPIDNPAAEQLNNNVQQVASSSDSSGNTVFNTACENTADEDEADEPSSIVNASMAVNLSNSNLNFSQFEDSSAGNLGRNQIEEHEEEWVVSGLKEPLEKKSCSSSSESTALADTEVENLMAPTMGPMGDGTRLPATVTVLTAPNGVSVYLVGTAHFSLQSQDDVVQTIRATQPTIVLLELCSSRKNILTLDEETVLKEASEMSFQKVRLALSNSGTVQGSLYLLLLSMSAQLTKKLGMAPGGEFRAAMREAKKIPGCVLLLGDRPFNITISRALAALTFFQKIKLGWQFLTSNEDITREEIEKCKEKDLLERMLSEMTGEFPSITEVFVNERDVYLAHSLFLAATSEAHRSNGGPIVGVVGMGHVPGIKRNWGKTTDEAVGGIIRIPETPLSTLIMRKTIKVVLYSACAYGVYRVGCRLFTGNAPGINTVNLVKGWWVHVGLELKRLK